jgi:hypothetical protein
MPSIYARFVGYFESWLALVRARVAMNSFEFFLCTRVSQLRDTRHHPLCLGLNKQEEHLRSRRGLPAYDRQWLRDSYV